MLIYNLITTYDLMIKEVRNLECDTFSHSLRQNLDFLFWLTKEKWLTL